MLLHFSALLPLVAPLVALAVPILIWQLKKDEMPAMDAHGKVVVNWLISYHLYLLMLILLSFVVIGMFLIPVLYLLGVIFPIVGGIKANEGYVWPYPLSIQFLN